MLKTLIIDINNYNEGDGISRFVNNTKFKVIYSLSDFEGCKDEAFLITDSRESADAAVKRGIGFSIYLNNTNREDSFKDCLYCLESFIDLEDNTIYKIYQRSLGKPWTIFENEMYIVREMTLDDVDKLYELYSDEEVKKYTDDLYENKEQEIEHTKNYIEYQYRFFEYGFWLVFDKNTNELIGRCGLSDREGFDATEIGFVFARKCWGRGIAFNICSEIISYAKDYLCIDRIISFTRKENVRAIKLLERLGFIFLCEELLGSVPHLKYEKKL